MFLFLLGCCPGYVSFYHFLCKLYALMSGKKCTLFYSWWFDIDTKSLVLQRQFSTCGSCTYSAHPTIVQDMLNQSSFFRISFTSQLERCMLIWYISETEDSTKVFVCFPPCVIKVLCWFHSSAYWCWSMAVALSETEENWNYFFLNKLNCLAEVSN